MRTLSIIFTVLFFGNHLSAQSLSSQVSSDSILFGNYFIYEIKLENIKENIDIPELDEFNIVSGPNQSSSISIINGKESGYKTFTWYLEPKDLGQYFIEPVAVKADGEIYETEPLEINVFPNPDGIIIKPELRSMDSFFDFQSPNIFGPRTKPTPPKTPSKPKRKLKKG